MDETLRVLEQTEALLTQVEENVKKLEAFKFDEIAVRIRKVVERNDLLSQSIRKEKFELLRTLTTLSHEIDRNDYQVADTSYTVWNGHVSVKKTRGKKDDYIAWGDFVNHNRYYELSYKIVDAVADHLSRLPKEQRRQMEEIAKLIKLGEKFSKLSS